MGICSINKTYRISNLNDIIDPFKSCRLHLIDKLVYFNKLRQKCNQAIETCLLTNDEHKAIIFKAKQLLIKKLENFLQEKIEDLDELAEKMKPLDKKKTFVEEILNELRTLIEKYIIVDDVEEIMGMKSENDYIGQLEKVLETDNLEKTLEIREKLRDQAEKINSLNKGSNYQRRRYIKSSLSTKE